MDTNSSGSNAAEKSTKVKSLKSKLAKKQSLIVVLTILVIGGVAGTVYFYQKYNDVKKNPAEAQQSQNTEETSRVLAKLKGFLRVDESEAPTVARVEDPEKLKTANSEFYKNVEKGDYLIIFPTRAVIFRESTGQIINIAPIINPSTQQSTEQQPATTNTNTNTNNRSTNR